MSMARYVFLNALPLNALNITKPTHLIVTPVKIDALRHLLAEAGEILCYIRHLATVNLLNKLLGLDMKPSAGLYTYQAGDVLYVVTLKKPVRGAEVENLTENDVLIFHVEVLD